MNLTRSIVDTAIDSIDIHVEIHDGIDAVLDELGDNWSGWGNPALFNRAMNHVAYRLHTLGVPADDLCEGHESLSGPIGQSSYCDGTCHCIEWTAR